MFGTLRLNPSDAGPIFVERADGASFAAMGNNVPQHMACDQCRQKKLRCSGRKTGCDRCKANSTHCTYTHLSVANGRRRERKRAASQSESRGPATRAPSPSPEEPESATTEKSIVVAMATMGSSPPSPSSRLANASIVDSSPVHVTSNEENGNATSAPNPPGHGISPPVQATGLPEDAYDVTNMSPNGWEEELGFFDLGPSVMATGRMAFDSDANSNLPSFHWSPCALPDIPSPYDRESTLTDAYSFTEPGHISQAFSRTSTATSTTRRLSRPVGGGRNCSGRCLQVMKSLLEEAETRLHETGTSRVDAALSFQKQACTECSQVLSCKSCYADSDAMMFVTIICDKLIMLTKKIFWYTVDGSSIGQQPLFVGKYEMDQFDEWGGMVQHLSALQVRKIKTLIDDIETSPAIDGKHAQLIMLQSVKHQANMLAGRIREAFSKGVIET